jgi:hypothetical protein
VGLSTLGPESTPFPDKWRWDAARVDTLPLLNRLRPGEAEGMWRSQLSQKPGQELLAEILMAQDEPVTLVVTGVGKVLGRVWKV